MERVKACRELRREKSVFVLWREKNKSHGDSTSGGFNPFSVSLTFRNSIGAARGKKLEESQRTARDAAIAG